MEEEITIETALKRKQFRHADFVAGFNGKSNRIKWVHVVEIMDIKHLLKGQELILTTGLWWKGNTSSLLSFLQQLIDCQVAGLCIELGTRMNSLPDEAIEFADRHQLPIILFREEVPFVEITQDLHASIINKQVTSLTLLETFSQKLNELLLRMANRTELVSLLQRYTDVQVIMRSQQETIYLPNCTKYEKDKLQKVVTSQSNKNTNIIKKHVHILGGNQLEIILVKDQGKFQEIDCHLLDKTVTALAQHLLRELYIEERRGVEEGHWLNGWLKGEHTEEMIHEYMYYYDSDISENGAVVCVLAKAQANSYKTELAYQKLLIRTTFEQEGFTTFLTEMPMQLGWILVNNRSVTDWKERVHRAINKLNQMERQEWHGRISAVGVGKFVSLWKDIAKSFETAKEAHSLIPLVKEKKEMYVFEDLQLYRMLSVFHNKTDLGEMMETSLKPVLDYDARYNAKLLDTLQMYLACQGSKQETAKRLYIVRQTLYHRIEKLETLLGSDFMDRERRLMIEWMLFAYERLCQDEKISELSRTI
ncbi:PucR family transcriptional regulator [Halalkalibacter lacteus]|uniref:PucR family transcriptional regulator n=1 Tax=Halalkalibacter lacteus TaxID=3090663 RepID=UPI002FCC504D